MLERLRDAAAVAALCAAAQAEGAAAYEVCDGAKAALTVALAQKTGRQTLYIAPGDREAARAAEDMQAYAARCAVTLRPRERQFARALASREGEWQRLTALERLRGGEARVLCVSAEALLWRMAPPEAMERLSVRLRVGDRIAPASLLARLCEAGYERADRVEGRGQCALRGAIVDVFPPAESDALRIEFFDDEVDSLRAFDCVSQRSVRRLEEARIPPASEYPTPAEERPRAGARIRAQIEEALERLQKARPQKRVVSLELDAPEAAEDAFFDADAPREGLRALLREAEALEAGGMCRDAGVWAHALLPRSASLLDYLTDPLVIVDTPERCRARMEDSLTGFANELALAIERQEAVPGQEALLFPLEEAFARVNREVVITLQELLRGAAGFRQGRPMRLGALSATQYHGNLRALAEELSAWREKGGETLLFMGGEARGERLRESLAELGVRLDEGTRTLPGALSRGFVWREAGLCVLSESDVYGASHRRARAQQTAGERIQAFTDLKEGDYVVHEMHGVGVYRGVTRIQSEGTWRDYLLIQYRGSDKLYVPTDQFDRVQKYVGSAEEPPPVNSLSGGEWQRQKARVKSGLKKLAFDLAQLYAARETTPGHAFAPDGAWSAQFDDGVPYELTPDQARAVEEIKRDMESPRNMDRLLCGDVGYGKTEVALRAAFKAISDGKQVALLAPTTILAQQHYYTCKKRFSEFPVTVEVVSRFRSPREQRDTLARTASGKVDLLIGTHRLLSKDVRFKDLGLLIVDEEQRFGVAHKESIKNMKKCVDVLTLSATPIPRTLHMSMVGVRDMSVLETPPEERVPVQTYVMDYNESVVRDAILREMGRQGQVYFLYNRVANIDAFAARLRQLVPEARIAVGHGQMQEGALEDVMLDFYAGRYDVLLCSTIIENGLDVPSANTLIVYDADRLGLAQLYQLRGRVGRSSRMAYAYFTVRPEKTLSEAAEKRLAAIREFTEFGAGFRIAMRDLEIRGAGDIFGAEQSGHIATVGYDMYCRLIEEAVREVKGEAPPPDELEPRIGLNVNAYLPEDYVRGDGQRVEVYRRIAMLRSMDDRADIIDELIDRFGDIPESVMTLLDVALLRALCVRLGIDAVQRRKDGVLLRFDMRFLPDLNALSAAMEGACPLCFAGARVPGLLLPLPPKAGDAEALKLLCAQLNGLTARMTEKSAEKNAAGK